MALKIYHDYYHAGLVEGIAQEVKSIIAKSRGTIVMDSHVLKGDYAYESFFQDVDIISRRDPTSSSDADIISLAQEELIKVALKRKIGPVDMPGGKFRYMGLTQKKAEQRMSFVLGKEAGIQKLRDQLNAGLTGIAAALAAQSGVYKDCTALTIAYADNLAQALQLMGDKQKNIVCWAMHSASQNDLLRGQISTDAPDQLASALIVSASPASLNRPVVVTDAPAFTNAAQGTSTSASADDVAASWYILGLTKGSLQLTETGEDIPEELERISGKENISYRYQGEFDFSVGIKGLKWDVSGGGANPADAALGTGSNWTKAVVNDKNLADVCIKVATKG